MTLYFDLNTSHVKVKHILVDKKERLITEFKYISC